MKSSTLLAITAFSAMLVTPVGAQVLRLHYEFNDASPTTTTTVNSGSDGATRDLTMRNSAGTPTHLLSADAAGVSGLAGDRALDFTSAVSMGGVGPIADGTVLSGTVTSFTVSGWFQTAGTTAIDGSARLWDLGGGDLQVFASATGTLNLQIGGGTSHLSLASYGATEEWVFYAITYDGTAAASQRVNFYIGGIDDSVTLVNTVSSAITSTGLSRLGIANRPGRDRAFDGLLDDMRFYTGADGAGALTLTQLEAIRTMAIPEPGTFALFATATCLVFAKRRRRLS